MVLQESEKGSVSVTRLADIYDVLNSVVENVDTNLFPKVSFLLTVCLPRSMACVTVSTRTTIDVLSFL